MFRKSPTQWCFVFFAASLFCFQFSSINYALADGVDVPISDGSEVDVSVRTDAQTLQAMTNTSFWWNYGRGIDVEACGKPIDDPCYHITDENRESCLQKVIDNQDENLKKGFYYQKLSNEQVCRKRCNYTPPSCSGIECVGDYLSFAGKKVLQATQICYAGCKDAVAKGIVIPAQCANINDNPEYQQAKQRAMAHQAQLNENPAAKKAAAEVRELTAQAVAAEKTVEGIKNAASVFKTALATTVKKDLLSLTRRIGKWETKTIPLVEKEYTDLSARMQKLADIMGEAKTRAPGSAEFRALESQLRSLQPEMCGFNWITPELPALAAQGVALDQELQSFIKKVEDKYITSFQSPQVTEKFRQDFQRIYDATAPYIVPQELASGAAHESLCREYGLNVRVFSLAKFALVASRYSNDAQALIREIEEILKIPQQTQDWITTKQTVWRAVMNLSREFHKFLDGNDIAATNAMTGEILKAIYLIMFPTIDLINPQIDGAADRLKKEIEEFLTADLQRWVDKKETLGLRTIVLAKAVKAVEHHVRVVDSVQGKAQAKMLLLRTLATWGLGKKFAEKNFAVPEQMDMAEALKWEFKFKKLDLALADFEFNLKSQEQALSQGGTR